MTADELRASIAKADMHLAILGELLKLAEKGRQEAYDRYERHCFEREKLTSQLKALFDVAPAPTAWDIIYTKPNPKA
jgi:hypothetical protein